MVYPESEREEKRFIFSPFRDKGEREDDAVRCADRLPDRSNTYKERGGDRLLTASDHLQPDGDGNKIDRAEKKREEFIIPGGYRNLQNFLLKSPEPGKIARQSNNKGSKAREEFVF